MGTRGFDGLTGGEVGKCVMINVYGGECVRLRPKPGDVVMVVLLLLVALVSPILFTNAAGSDLTAVVTQDGEEMARIRLSGLEEAIAVPYGGAYPGVILAENGRIRFLEAECPDHVCVDTGWLSRAGSIAACLPARVLIRLEGSEQGDVDVRLQ
jgi:hypothetical protein